jgi:EAL domain-containing protein (putative c-di-GMP-specific phosphodiesterase class I)
MCTKELFDEEIAKRITFEITETAAQKDLRKTAYFTAAIQALGSEVSLDDFGVGFTSFRQLRSLSINSIKIDGSFVLGLEENKENLIFIRSLIDFGKSYGLKTVAECVENGEVAKKLIDLGVDYMQGYYFGAPEVKKPWIDKKIA